MANAVLNSTFSDGTYRLAPGALSLPPEVARREREDFTGEREQKGQTGAPELMFFPQLLHLMIAISSMFRPTLCLAAGALAGALELAFASAH